MAEKVILDVSRSMLHAWIGQQATGIDRVELEYVRHFRNTGRAMVRFRHRWVCFGEADTRKLFDLLLQDEPASRIRLGWLAVKGYLLSWRAPQARDVLINTAHLGLDDRTYAGKVRRRGLRAVYFLHDLIPITHPEYCGPRAPAAHHRRMSTILESASAVLVNSTGTGRELQEYAVRKGGKAPRWRMAPLGPGRLCLPAGPRPLAEPYFVMLSTIEPRKNHLLLLEIWREMVQQLGDRAPRLVVIGRRGWECEQVTNFLDRCPALRGFVTEVAGCGDAQLAAWLAHAQALLFPTFTEGFGLPLLEALTLGVPAIVSELENFREFARDVPEYVSPIDGLGWKRLILQYATDSDARKAQLARIAGYRAPTWDEHFQVVDKLLAEL
jgi:glycosyltransferase involved in cell wall biosynthesis